VKVHAIAGGCVGGGGFAGLGRAAGGGASRRPQSDVPDEGRDGWRDGFCCYHGGGDSVYVVKDNLLSQFSRDLKLLKRAALEP
jgi:hypothetical protein